MSTKPIPIVYFTSSNNTAYVAKLIALGLEKEGFQPKLISIKDLKVDNHDIANAEVIGVGAPIYGGFAEPIKNWVKAFDFTNKRVFLFSTAGIWHFGSTSEIIRIVKKNNGDLIGAFEMTFRGCMDGIVYSKRLSEKHPIKRSDLERAFDFGCSIAGVLKNRSGYVDNTHKHHLGGMMLVIVRGVKFVVLKLFKLCLYVTDSNKCISCLKCEKACPTGAISVKEKKIRINHKSCISCCKCFKECPTRAVALRFVGDKPYYRGPWQLAGYIDPTEILIKR